MISKVIWQYYGEMAFGKSNTHILFFNFDETYHTLAEIKEQRNKKYTVTIPMFNELRNLDKEFDTLAEAKNYAIEHWRNFCSKLLPKL